MGEREKDRFSAAAAGWDVLPERLRRSEMVAEYIRDKVRLEPGRTEMLDFGCGTGQLAFCLRRYVRKVTAVDSAPGMIEELQKKVAAQGVRNIEARLLDVAHEARLLPRAGFDFITSLMALHHIEDYRAVLRELKPLLRPAGVLCLVDLDLEDGSFHDQDQFIPHRGFSRQELGEVLERIGFFDVVFHTPYTIKKKDVSGAERAYPLFLALAYNGKQ